MAREINIALEVSICKGYIMFFNLNFFKSSLVQRTRCCTHKNHSLPVQSSASAYFDSCQPILTAAYAKHSLITIFGLGRSPTRNARKNLLFLNHRTKFLSHTTLSSFRPSSTSTFVGRSSAHRIPSQPIICVNNCHQLNVAIIKPVIVRIAFHRAVVFQRGPYLNGQETSTDVIDMHVKRLNF